MHPEQPGAVLELGPLARREVIEEVENASLIEHSSGPCRTGGHQPVPTHKISVDHRFVRSGVRMRLIVGQHVPIRVPGDEGDVLELAQHFEHLDRMWSEQDEIAEGPPTIDPELCTINQHCTESTGNSMDAGDDPKSHGSNSTDGESVPERREGSRRLRLRGSWSTASSDDPADSWFGR